MSGAREVVLDGFTLTIEQVIDVARHGCPVRLADEAVVRIQRGRAVVDVLVERGVKVYGLTTGFGSKRDVVIDGPDVRRLQMNLIVSHACAVGAPLPEDQARATMLLRANTLARGVSGVRVDVVERLIALLNGGVYPWIPSKGSLGASGDLAPLSHLALVVVGHPAGRIYGDDERRPNRRGELTVQEPTDQDFVASTAETLGSRFGLEPIALEAKEGLALNNGTQMMAAIGVLGLFDTEQLVRTAEIVCAASIEAIKGMTGALDPRLHEARPFPGQVASAANLRRLLEGSRILSLPLNMARVGSARRSVEDAMAALEVERSVRAEEVTEGLRRVLVRIDAVREDPEAALEAHLAAIPAARRAQLADAQAQHAALRAALAPVLAELQGVYQALLTPAISEEALPARDHVMDAMAALERAVPKQQRVQDNYSFRCMPQVAGAVRQVLDHVRQGLTIEINAATDNPLIFPPDAPGVADDDLEGYRASLTVPACVDAVVSGGNFHGEPVGFLMDYLAIGIAELGSIAERRTAQLTDGHLNNGLPSLLVWRSGLNSGLMIPQYTAASLVSESKILTHPATTDSIPSCENTEDHVSMGTIAARKAIQVLENVESVIGIELLTAYQALSFRRPLQPGAATRAVQAAVEEAGGSVVTEDRPMYPEIERTTQLVRSGALLRAVEAVTGRLT